MRRFLYLIAILNLCLVSPLFAQSEIEKVQSRIKAFEDSLQMNPTNTRILLKLGVLYHKLGVQGDKKAVKKAEDLFKRLLELEPENAEAHSWYGSVLTLKGRDAWLPISKMRYVNSGIKEMDKAVQLAPDNITVRMIRANNSLALPELFHRTEVAITDFEYLLSLARKRPEEFNKTLLGEIYLKLGNAYRKKGDIIEARENWQKAIKISPDSKEAEKARKLLEETKGRKHL